MTVTGERAGAKPLSPRRQRKLRAGRALEVVRGHKCRALRKGDGDMDVGNGDTAARLAPRPVPSEEAWLAIEIAISRFADGSFVARVSFDEDASWVDCRASDPITALEGAAVIARERAEARAQLDGAK
jgi:hypothetical protein